MKTTILEAIITTVLMHLGIIIIYTIDATPQSLLIGALLYVAWSTLIFLTRALHRHTQNQ